MGVSSRFAFSRLPFHSQICMFAHLLLGFPCGLLINGARPTFYCRGLQSLTSQHMFGACSLRGDVTNCALLGD